MGPQSSSTSRQLAGTKRRREQEFWTPPPPPKIATKVPYVTLDLRETIKAQVPAAYFSIERSHPFETALIPVPTAIINSRPNFLQLHVLCHKEPMDAAHPIKLLKIPPQAWNLFMSWLYYGIIPAPEEQWDFLSLYLFAVETLMVDLQNECMTTMIKWYRKHNEMPSLQVLHGAYCNALIRESPNSKLRLFFGRIFYFLKRTYAVWIGKTVYRIHGAPEDMSLVVGQRWTEEDGWLSKLMDEGFPALGDDFYAVGEMMTWKPLKDPREVILEGRCEYHVHKNEEEVMNCKVVTQVIMGGEMEEIQKGAAAVSCIKID